jgi:hypothetical protein
MFHFCIKEFIVNTPNTLAQKYWITNGAVHAKHVVVMAQLEVKGQNHGIHAILGKDIIIDGSLVDSECFLSDPDPA